MKREKILKKLFIKLIPDDVIDVIVLGVLTFNDLDLVAGALPVCCGQAPGDGTRQSTPSGGAMATSDQSPAGGRSLRRSRVTARVMLISLSSY